MSSIQIISLLVFAFGIIIIPLADYLFFTKSFDLNFSKDVNPTAGEVEVSKGLKDKFAEFVDGLAEKYGSEFKSSDADDSKRRQQKI